MLKFEQDSTIYNFDLLPIGETFLIKNADTEEGYEWYGMKVACLCGHEPIYYIMDISDRVGELYEYHKDYHIIDIVDLKIVRDEGKRINYED